MARMTLSEALVTDRLEAFVEQVEADGIGPVPLADLEAGLGELIKELTPEGQTSRSPARGE